MISFPTSAFWVDNDRPEADVEELQDWLREGKRYAVIPAPNKTASGGIAQAAIQGRIAPENICVYASVPVTNLEAPNDRAAASECLSEQLELASCLGIKFFVFQRAGTLADSDLVSFCHLIAKSCGSGYGRCRDQVVINCDAACDWDLWKCMSKLVPEMKLCLSLTSDYSWLDDDAFDRMMLKWRAENITMILCCRDSVKLNQAEQPSMSRRNREIVLSLGINRAAIVAIEVDQLIDGCAETPAITSEALKASPKSPATAALPNGWPYAKKMYMWLQYVHQKYCEVSNDDAMRMLYKDLLQEPLQPLAFNLSLQQYLVFEEDTVKYALYQVVNDSERARARG